MAITHLVKQGEHLSRIAAEHGFADFRSIWDHPKNAALKQQRLSPHILFPGDVLFIPDREERIESRATEKRHRFELQGQPLKVRLALKSLANKPMRDTRCRITVEAATREVSTNTAGIINQEIPKEAESGSLLIRTSSDPLPLEVSFKIGHLDPIETESGQMARLNNLGYMAGDLFQVPTSQDEKKRMRDQFRSAVEEFQCDNRPPLAVDGVCGPKTQAKLKELHGC